MSEFMGPNVFAKTSEHKQPNPHSHWRHKEPVFERETLGESLVADIRALGRIMITGAHHARNILREQLARPEVSPLTIGSITMQENTNPIPPQEETAA